MVGVQHVRGGRRGRTGAAGPRTGQEQSPGRRDRLGDERDDDRRGGRPDGRRQVRSGRRGGSAPSTGAGRARAAVRLLALLLGWCLGTGGLGVVVAQAAAAVAAPGPARLEDAVALVTGGAALLASWWLAVAVLASVWAAVLTRRRPDGVLARAATGVARRTAPAGVRRAALLAVGLSLTGATGPALAAARPAAPAPVCATAPCLDPGWGAGPAPAIRTARPSAVPTTVAPARAGATDPASTATVAGAAATAATAATATVAGVAAGARDGSLDPGWVPQPPGRTAPVRRQATLPGTALRPRHAARDEVVVHAGDSLWTIVERYLGPHATAAQVAVEWPRWHAANRSVVGADPDRLLPGQVLRPPAAASSGRVRPPGGPGVAAVDGPAAGGAR